MREQRSAVIPSERSESRNPPVVAVGLLFAGSSIATIVNQIENVRSLLRVEVAEEIL